MAISSVPSGCHPRAAPLAPSAAAKRQSVSPATSEPIPVRFVDITQQSGIKWSHFSGARGKKYMPEVETPGCAFVDYNIDGRPDILLLNGADWPEVRSDREHSRCALYRNDGGGKFTDVTAGSGLDIEMHTMGVAVGDYDNDGYPDLYITCVLGSCHLFHNDHNGHFTDVTIQAGVDNNGKWGSGAAWIDYDRDGKLDLVVGNYCKWTPKTDIFCTVFKGKKSYCTPNVYDGESLRLYHQERDGRFRDVTAQAGLTYTPGKSWGIVALDFDDDGWPDIAVANDMEPNCLFHNQKNGTFKEIGVESGIALGENGNAKAGMGIDCADIDNSGRPSLLISNFSGEGLSLFRNLGAGQFNESSHAWEIADASLLRMGWGLFFFDYDLDGRIDALVANGHLYENVHEFQPDVTYAEAPLLFRNVGSKFQETAAQCGPDLAKPMVARGAAYADIDGDGDLDILLMGNNGRPRLLRNDGGNANGWLRVKTVGSQSNRDGIGAKLVADVGGIKQTRWVHSGSSFLSSCEMTVTFGIGNARKVDRLTVSWPSGHVDNYADLPAKTTLVAKEGTLKHPL